MAAVEGRQGMSWADLPQWTQFLVMGLLIFSWMSLTAVILSRAGKSPYWALISIIPYFVVVAIWFFAFTKWPKVDAQT
jgi:hypothetical protein